MSDEKNNSRLYDKLDILDMRLDSMDKSLVKLEVNMTEHMRRTKAAEDNIDLIRKDVAPVQKHVNMVEGAFKFLGVISMGLGILGTILKIFGAI